MIVEIVIVLVLWAVIGAIIGNWSLDRHWPQTKWGQVAHLVALGPFSWGIGISVSFEWIRYRLRERKRRASRS